MNKAHRKKFLEVIEPILKQIPSNAEMIYVSIVSDKVMIEGLYRKSVKWALIVPTEEGYEIDDSDSIRSSIYSI